MDRYKNHFLDSCAVIGKLLDFDPQHEHADKYFKKKHKRHTSERVITEISNRLNEIRREILGFIDWVKNNEFGGIPTDQHIWGYIYKYKLYDDKKKNKDMIKNFYQKYYSIIKDYILQNNISLMEDIQETVVDSIGDAYDDLTYLVEFNHDYQIMSHPCPESYDSKTKFQNEYKNVNRVLKHESDSLVLIDSYYVKDEVIKEDIGFITTDNEHILSNSIEIENVLTGLFIFDMRES